MKYIKFLVLMLSAVILFSACGTQSGTDITSKTENTSIESAPNVSSGITNDTESTSADESVELSVDESSAPEISEPVYDDLLSLMTDCGKEVTAYGDLTFEEYSDALDELETVLDGYDREVSLVIYSLDNMKAVCYNTEASIFCASAIKASYVLYACKQMESGNGNLDTELIYESKYYETGTGDLQYQPVGSVFDMETVLGKCMSISDNVGYNMAVDHFGREGYNDWVTGLNCLSLVIKPTVWSLHTKAEDLAFVWREIYNYFGEKTDISEFLYESCTNTANNFATASLDADYSHKQGNNRSGDWHSYSDAGIVWDVETPYIFCILTDAPGPSDHDAKLMSDVMNIIDKKLF